MPNPDYDGVNVMDQFLDPNGNPTNDPALAAQILDDTYPVTVTGLKDLDGVLKPGAADAPLEDNDLYGSIQSPIRISIEKGEYSTQNDVNTVDPDAAIKRGIPYYQMALDSLAKEFAEQMNALNTPGAGVSGEGALFSMGSNNNDTTNITASNISVSQAWGEGNVTMIASQDPNASSGDTSNLAAFLNLFTKKQAFDPKDVAGADAVGAIYNGSFEDMLLRIQSTLAEDQMTTGDVYNNYTLTSNEIYTDRDSVSGVDLNDEATNLMVYQKAYAAACRLMTTLNTALDSLLAM